MTHVVLALLRPGVDSKVVVAAAADSAGEVDDSCLGSGPALAGGEVTDVVPVHGVFTGVAVGVGGVATAAVIPLSALLARSLEWSRDRKYIKNW